MLDTVEVAPAVFRTPIVATSTFPLIGVLLRVTGIELPLKTIPLAFP
jgi:hypothetical protein